MIRSNSRAVQIDVSAKDRDDHAVNGLAAADFHVADSGKPPGDPHLHHGWRRLSVHSAPRARPAWPPGFFSTEGKARTLPGHAAVILIDGINSAFENQAQVRQQALAMLGRLPLADPIAIYAMTPGLRVLHDYGTDRGQLAESIRAFVPARPPMPEGGGLAQVQLLMENRVGDTLNTLCAPWARAI